MAASLQSAMQKAAAAPPAPSIQVPHGLTLQRILRDAFESFADTHPLAGYARRAARRMVGCRTAALGGHVESCPAGHVVRVHYNSCRQRSCPQCAGLQRDMWLARQRARLPACRYFHIIFTVSDLLHPIWRYNKPLFANLMFRAVRDCLIELLGDAAYLGALPGLLAALHTWGQTLNEHLHIHVLVTAGGLSRDGRWIKPKKSCLLPREVLMRLFRGKLRAYLLDAARPTPTRSVSEVQTGELQLPPDWTLRRLKGLLNKLGRVPWNVKILDQYEHGDGVASYLARYLRGGPLPNSRLVSYQDGQVTFRYQDNRDHDPESGQGRRKIMSLAVADFLGRLLEHVVAGRDACGPRGPADSFAGCQSLLAATNG